MKRDVVSYIFIFFFKQKTAYEIYQCDWSSDVCSSDLVGKTGTNCQIFGLINKPAAQAATVDFLKPDDIIIMNHAGDAIEVFDTFAVGKNMLPTVGQVMVETPCRNAGLNIIAEQTKLLDRKSTRLNSSHTDISRMPSSA